MDTGTKWYVLGVVVGILAIGWVYVLGMVTIGKADFSAAQSVGGMIAAVGGLLAGAGAFYSARIASHAEERSRETERRQLVRDVVTTANRIVAETIQIDDLGSECESAYTTLFSFSAGGSSSGILRQHLARIQLQRSRVLEHQAPARQWVEEMKKHHNTSIDTLTDQLLVFESSLIQIGRVKERLQRELSSVRDQNRIRIRNAISQVNGSAGSSQN